MVMMDAFLAGDVFIGFAYESATFQYELATGNVFRLFYAHANREISANSDLYSQTISAGTLIMQGEYLRD